MERMKAPETVDDILEAKRRADNCLVDIQKILEKWECTIGPSVVITARGIQSGYEIIPLNKVKIPGSNN